MNRMILILAFLIPSLGFGQASVNIQLSSAFTVYNEIRSPGDSGTFISLSDTLTPEAAISPRLETGYYFGRHYAGLMGTLLRVRYEGRLDKEVLYEGKTFTKGSEVLAKYRFDSYRLYYRYTFFENAKMKFEGGAAIKMRDASVSLESGSGKAEKSNIGFVPLLTVKYELFLSDMVSLLVQGDGLAAPQGRAEDFLFGVTLKSDKTKILAGYRFLEGGGDNDEVYTFAMFNYIVIGMELVF
ncbi:MAG: hypothetical protein N3B13_10565 [Deltaproteobacteria bacterium]|nr:hypothetical protein [Deltaproteobacteria bacterium]